MIRCWLCRLQRWQTECAQTPTQDMCAMLSQTSNLRNFLIVMVGSHSQHVYWLQHYCTKTIEQAGTCECLTSENDTATCLMPTSSVQEAGRRWLFGKKLTAMRVSVTEYFQVWGREDIIRNIVSGWICQLQGAQWCEIASIWNWPQLRITNIKMVQTVMIQETLWKVSNFWAQ